MRDMCLVAQSCLTLCNPMDCSPPGSSVHVSLQARILEWVAMPPPGDLPDPGINPGLSHFRQILYHLSHQGSLKMKDKNRPINLLIRSQINLASLVAQTIKGLPVMQETWVEKIPWRRAWQPTPVFLPGESHGVHGRLAGYSPCGRKESDRTEQMTHTNLAQCEYSEGGGAESWGPSLFYLYMFWLLAFFWPTL